MLYTAASWHLSIPGLGVKYKGPPLIWREQESQEGRNTHAVRLLGDQAREGRAWCLTRSFSVLGKPRRRNLWGQNPSAGVRESGEIP